MGLTGAEALRLPEGARYWFMDERTAPSITILLCAAGIMALFGSGRRSREALEAPWRLESRAARALSALGRCSFCVYLLQDALIEETRSRVFIPLGAAIHPVPAVLLWELLVYGAAAAVALGLTRIPGLRRLL
jgi:peptidoglycan/LPS O-acetylase OafA/YrhL